MSNFMTKTNIIKLDKIIDMFSKFLLDNYLELRGNGSGIEKL